MLKVNDLKPNKLIVICDGLAAIIAQIFCDEMEKRAERSFFRRIIKTFLRMCILPFIIHINSF